MIQSLKSEPAVSPVIGTILLVAIAVILALIILIVVMGFSGDTNEKKVGMNAKSESGANATLILYGGASIDELIKLEMIDMGSPNGTYVEFWNITNGSAFIGIPYLAENVAQPLKAMAVYDTRINVRGTFSDGTDLILLVQSMTFYDVSPPKTGPTIHAPKVGGASDTDKREKTFSVRYANTTSAPESCIIHYQPEGDSAQLVSVDAGAGRAFTGNTDFSIPATLKEGVTYEIWGELIINGQSYQGPVTTYKLSDLGITVSAIITQSDNSFRKNVEVKYGTAMVYPSGSFICYQPEGGEPDQAVRIDTGAQSGYSGKFYAEIILSPGITYEVWAELIVDGETVIGTPKTVMVYKTEVSTISANAGDNLMDRNLIVGYKYPTSAPTHRIIYYQPQDKSESAVPIDLGAGEYTTGGTWKYFNTTVRLKQGVIYNVWGEIITAEGTFTGDPKTYTMTTIYTQLDVIDTDDPLMKTLRLLYRYAPSVPLDCIIYCQPEGDASRRQTFNMGSGVSSNDVTYLYADVTLSPGTYEYWGEIVTSDETFTTKVSKFQVRA